MKFDSTVTLSIILAIVALFAPIFTTMINNRYKIKMKKIDLLNEKYANETLHVKKLFESFLQDYGIYQGGQKTVALENLKGSYYKCLPYVPKKHSAEFINFYNTLVDRHAYDSKQIMNEKLIFVIKDILDGL